MFVILILLFFSLALVLGGKMLGDNNCKDCNVILISIDTLRKDSLGIYGYDKPTSPNIDSFAKDARVYDNMYSTSPWTLPAHASMFTSLYPKEAKMQTIADKLDKNLLTIADVLKENGYYTIGWDGNTFVSERWGFTDGFDDYFTVSSMAKGHHDANLIFPQAVEWIKNNKEKKFFMFLHSFQVHDPYCPPAEFDKFKGDYKGETKCIDISHISKKNRKEISLSDDELSRFRSLYDGEILYTDKYLGELFKMLTQTEFRNTIVIITSDHGEEFGERGLWGSHGNTLYNELVSVPLIISAPNLSQGRDENVFSMIDIAPTILDLLGINKRDTFKGISVREADPKRLVFFETNLNATLTSNLDKQYGAFESLKPVVRKENLPTDKVGVVLGEWKLIKDKISRRTSLYNTKSNPKETKDVSEENPQTKQTLENLILKY